MDRIKSMVPGVDVKLYEDLFYEFNRSKCDEEVKRNLDWDHVILTANLVADEKKQAEYLKYHQQQFKDWPEVSKGFCNASFQQLLLFKKGRQLMLVISIPKGASFDALNPKTTENNPRVDEWNKLMGPYQEGIEGTAKDEKWIFLKKIK
jgi:L-rhamnose mutarotase